MEFSLWLLPISKKLDNMIEHIELSYEVSNKFCSKGILKVDVDIKLKIPVILITGLKTLITFFLHEKACCKFSSILLTTISHHYFTL